MTPTSAPDFPDEIIRRAAMIKLGREELESKWSDEGCCNSCGWHAALYEHGVEDWEIIEAVQGDGVLKLGCASKDDEDTDTHRGVKVRLSGTKDLFNRPQSEASALATPVPVGWKLVPIEPTEEMLSAATMNLGNDGPFQYMDKDAYSAMLESAPPHTEERG